MSAKITFEHFQKFAYIYIRQSSQQQVEKHTTSQEVQRNLKIRALDLGWAEQKIKIIDDDLGVSASSAGIRSGLQKTLFLSTTGLYKH